MGMYSAEQPFWAAVSDVRYLTTEQSEDRKVRRLVGMGAGHGVGVRQWLLLCAPRFMGLAPRPTSPTKQPA
jgi:hypothetical protein